ncbi:hypothetical protein FJZ36_12025 [Candidatus Poribacteria bacterium]|nr:hypothetical protein [Candidatus Poribacteria bacterium]
MISPPEPRGSATVHAGSSPSWRGSLTIDRADAIMQSEPIVAAARRHYVKDYEMRRLIGICGAILGIALMLGASVAANAAEKNLVPNPDFEDGTVAPWHTYGDASITPAKKADARAGKGAALVTVNAKGVNFWDSGVQYNAGITFTKNVQYTWAIFFRADKDRRINMKPELSVDPWTAYGEAQKNVTTEWAEYYVQFKPNVDVVPASLTLHIAEVPVNFYMDDVRWYEGTYVPADGVKAVEPKAKLAVSWAELKK